MPEPGFQRFLLRHFEYYIRVIDTAGGRDYGRSFQRSIGEALTRRNQLVLSCCAIAIALVSALMPAGAEAKTERVRSSIDLDVVGLIDRHGGVSYDFVGGVGAEGFTFA